MGYTPLIHNSRNEEVSKFSILRMLPQFIVNFLCLHQCGMHNIQPQFKKCGVLNPQDATSFCVVLLFRYRLFHINLVYIVHKINYLSILGDGLPQNHLILHFYKLKSLSIFYICINVGYAPLIHNSKYEKVSKFSILRMLSQFLSIFLLDIQKQK